MGFGLICAGYTTMLFMRLIPAELIGFIVVAKGLSKLRDYNSFFKAALYCTYAIIAFSAVDAVIWIMNLLKIISLGAADELLSYIHILFLLPFHFFLARATGTISEELSFAKGVRRSKLALAVTTVYYIISILTLLGVLGGYFGIILYLVNFLVTEICVYTCYMGITTDEDEKREEAKIEQFEKRFGRKKDNKKVSSKNK